MGDGRGGARAAAAAALLLSLPAATAWYIPGVTPVSYVRGQPLRIMANSMTSSSGLLPYSAYSIKTCAPSSQRIKAERKHENLGELLYGDEILPSLYRAEMLVDAKCRKLCEPIDLNPADRQLLERRIEQYYRGNLILDNLPVVMENRASAVHPPLSIGYPLGVPKKWSPDKSGALLNNHLAITIDYHRPQYKASALGDEDAWRIVGFSCVPHSVQHADPSKCTDSGDFRPEDLPKLKVSDATSVLWSYSVSWRENTNTEWATRWDIILRSAPADAKIHWFSIINSLLIVLFLSGMVAMILLRSLHKDFNRYNDPDNEEAAQEETGWKLVHGDVFRPPAFASLLAVLVGTGVQLLGCGILTLLFALLGFLSPANRGGLLTAMLLLFVLLGGYAGYVSARFCKSFRCQSWFNAFLTGTLFPGSCMGTYFVINLVQWAKKATSAIPFTSLLSLFGMWFGISLPLVIVGAAVGYKRPPMEAPCEVNAIPRAVPPQRWYLRSSFVIPLAGILPFGAVFIELVFILSSIWQGRVYYVFGFLALVFIIAIITCAEISVVIVYFQLCYEDHHWWWRAFLSSAAAGGHLFLYSIFYYFHTLTISQLSSTIIYFGYMSMMSYLFALSAGTIGFLSSYFFVRFIYASIKVD
eukprot:TRINITY_DN10935_c0_g5_i1.p1 TRINITY_DN10935_c0_g5~~TRINITY_DN10935_c0_g5_i1.p1  ORF type:complete len:680 (+),score=241.80 TRINITY_DN10935_c0_g5_i1:118-2040(+)